MRENWLKIISLVIVVIAMVIPRGFELDRFATPDEPKWLTRSANFFLALAQRDFENTYQKEHPGVTVMWAGAVGLLRQYPQYVTQGPGQQDRPQKFKRYLDNHNIQAINLLEAGRVFVVIGILVTLALAYWAAIKLFGLLTAFVGFLLIAFDPFSIALSRLLHLDGLVSALLLLSLLALMNYLYRGRQPAYLILSAIAAGLGWLTKSPSLFLLPFFVLLAFIELLRTWHRHGQLLRRDIWMATWPILAWTGIAALVFVLFFPSMWVQPVRTLNEIFLQAWLYASEGHSSPTFFDGIIFSGNIDDWRFYPLSYLWRTTPITLAGLFLLLLAFILRRRITFSKDYQRIGLVLGLFVVLYTIFMTLGGKKFDRYLLPIFAPLNLLAAMGWVTIFTNALNAAVGNRIGSKYPHLIKASLAAFIGAIFIWQTWGVMQTSPYYFSYYNPLMGGTTKAPQVMMIGWGEGLDEAARYLNAKPDAENIKVTSWYQDGPFSYFFKGKTVQEDFPNDPQDLAKVSYVVIYIHQWQRQLPSREFLDYFDQLQPEHTVWIEDLPYAYIYRME